MSHFRRGPPSAIGTSLLLPADRAQGETLQLWLHRALRGAIDDGRLAPGTALPASRALAAHLSVSRGTITAVYDQLVAEGQLVARRGSGTVVNPRLPESLHTVPRSTTDASRSAGRRGEEQRAARGHAALGTTAPGHATPRHATPGHATPGHTALGRSVARHGSPFSPAHCGVGQAPLTPHLCDYRSFPLDVWRRLYGRHLRSSRLHLLADGPPEGLYELRRAIAAHVSIARGVAVEPSRVVVVSSVQQALDIAARLVLAPGDTAWMEDPGYPGARRVLDTTGARVVDVPIDADGIDIDEGQRLAPGVRLTFVTPSRQAPLGVALAPHRRQRLLAWATPRSAYVFEDDYDSEFRFNARPVAALKSGDKDERVFLAGSFGKLLFPGLRLSWVIPPAALLHTYVAALSIAARHPNAAAQAVLADFIDGGHFDRHVRRMRRRYAARAEALVDAAHRHWAGLLAIPAVQAGLDVTAALVDRGNELDLACRLRHAGLGPRALQTYTATHKMPPALVIGFASFDEAVIHDAARDVALVMRG